MSRRPSPKVEQQESFLKRWSNRKQSRSEPNPGEKSNGSQETSGEQIPLNTIVPESGSGRMQTTVEADRINHLQAEEVVEKPVLTDADMPLVDSLDEHSDYSGFLSSGVSEALRKRALRQLFSAAVFNVRDGLDDYDEDFTSFEPLGDLVTSDMKHQAEVKERRRQQDEEAEQLAAKESSTDETPAPEKVSTDEPDDVALAEDSNADQSSAQGQAEEMESHTDEEDPTYGSCVPRHEFRRV